MTKTDKKRDNTIRKALTDVCEFALDNIKGYQWITHSVNYSAFPTSLLITCAFASEDYLNQLKGSGEGEELIKLIIARLDEVDIKVVNAAKQIKFTVA